MTGNEPAYPGKYKNGGISIDYPGVSIREYFSVLALQGLSANSDTNSWTAEAIAKVAVASAEALIKELSKPKDEGII